MAFSLKNLFQREAVEDQQNEETPLASSELPITRSGTEVPTASPVHATAPPTMNMPSPFQPIADAGFTVRELCILIPHQLARADALPPGQVIALPIDQLRESFHRGKPSLRLSQIYAACPFLFKSPVQPAEDSEVVLPYQKVKRLLEGGAPAPVNPFGGVPSQAVPPSQIPATTAASPFAVAAIPTTPPAPARNAEISAQGSGSGYFQNRSTSGNEPPAALSPFSLVGSGGAFPAAPIPGFSALPANGNDLSNPSQPETPKSPFTLGSASNSPFALPAEGNGFPLKSQIPEPKSASPFELAIPNDEVAKQVAEAARIPAVPLQASNSPFAMAQLPAAQASAPSPFALVSPTVPPAMVPPGPTPASPGAMSPPPAGNSPFALVSKTPTVDHPQPAHIPPVPPPSPGTPVPSRPLPEPIKLPSFAMPAPQPAHSAPPPQTPAPAMPQMPPTTPEPVKPVAPPALAAATPAPTSPESSSDGVILGLANSLRGVSTNDLGFNPANIPDAVRVNFPLSLIKPQLAEGRVVVSIKDIINGVAEKFRPAFALANPALEVPLPLSEVFHNLPPQAFPAAEEMPAPAAASVFQTPFALKAHEDELMAATKPERIVAKPASKEGFTLPPLLINQMQQKAAEASHTAPVPAPPVHEPISFPVTPEAVATPARTGFGAAVSKEGMPIPPTPSLPVPAQATPRTETPPGPFSKPPAANTESFQFFSPTLPSAPTPAAARPAPPFEAPKPEPAAENSQPAEAKQPTPPAPWKPAPDTQYLNDDDLGSPRSANLLSSPPPASFVPRQAAPPTGPEAPALVPDIALPPAQPPPVHAEPVPPPEASAFAQPPPASPSVPEKIQASSGERNEDLTFGYVKIDERQLALRAIFMTEKTLRPEDVVDLSSQFPGIRSCLIITPGGTTYNGRDQATEEVQHFSTSASQTYQNLKGLAESIGMATEGTFTLRSESGVRTFFLEGTVCLAVLHEEPAFRPGVREKLIMVTREMAKMLGD